MAANQKQAGSIQVEEKLLKKKKKKSIHQANFSDYVIFCFILRLTLDFFFFGAVSELVNSS